MNKILFLYSELGPYMTSFLEKISSSCSLTCVYWDRKLLRPEQSYRSRRNLIYIPKSDFNFESDRDFDLVYISGWMDFDYLLYARKLKRDGAAIVVGFDDRWRGSIKQLLCLFPFKLVRPFLFDFAWVAGFEQWHFARRLGFRPFEIRTHLLTSNCLDQGKSDDYKSDGIFLYVGTISRKKGVDLLVDAYLQYRENGGRRNLTICGHKSEDILIPDIIKHEGFLTPIEVEKKYQEAACLIVPSRSEQWGVVINEAMSNKLPLIISDVVGSIGSLAIPNLNCLLAKPTINSLSNKLTKFDKLDTAIKHQMSRESSKIIKGFTQEIGISQFKSFQTYGRD